MAAAVAGIARYGVQRPGPEEAMVRWSVVGIGLAGLVGCESGLAARVDIELKGGVAEAFTKEAPGIVVADVGAGAEPVVPLCGGPAPEDLGLYHDYGFGCMDGDQKGVTGELRAWVQPMPEGWDAAGFCRLTQYYDSPLDVPSEVSGDPTTPTTTPGTATAVPGTVPTDLAPVVPGLAAEPEADWPQGSVTGEWHGTPICGGTLRSKDPVVIAP